MSMTEGYLSHVEDGAPRFMIHFQGAPYANELYGVTGDYIYVIEEAVEQAEQQFGPDGWEVYNGNEAINRFRE